MFIFTFDAESIFLVMSGDRKFASCLKRTFCHRKSGKEEDAQYER